MNKKAQLKLEYNKIIDLLEEQASSPSGKNRCKKLSPMLNIGDINLAQEQTASAFTRIVKKGRISFSGCYPIEDSLMRLEVGGVLTCNELLRIAKLLQVTNRVKSFGRHDTVDDLEDCLDTYFNQLEPLGVLSNEISRCILGEDEISDDASSTLKHIRRSIQLLNERVHSTLTSLVSGSLKSYLQDSLITMRRQILYSRKSRIQKSGPGHDSRPVFNRLHFIYRAYGDCKIKQ